MRTIARILPLASILPLLSACGSSSTVRAESDAGPSPTPTVTEDAGDDTTPPAAVRTMKTTGLLPGGARNLIIDPFMSRSGQSSGWGHFIALYEGTYNQATYEVRVLGTAPGGVSSPVAIIKDTAGTDTKTKAILCLTSFIGGKGPYQAKVWLSPSNMLGNAVELPADATAIRVTITSATGPSSASYDLKRDDSQTMKIGDRTWVLHQARIDATLPGGGFFTVRTGKLGGTWWVTAPEVVALDEGLPMPMTLKTSAKARPLDPSEVSAIAAYQRMPVRLEGAPRGKKALEELYRAQ